MTSYQECRPRVVLADDHRFVVAALGRLLERCCEVVGRVSSGYEAIEAVARLKPDILVVDLMMPDMDGLEVCGSVKQRTPDTDVVILTAFDDEHIQTIAFRRGAAAFIPKHLAASTLDRTIQRLFVEKQLVRS